MDAGLRLLYLSWSRLSFTSHLVPPSEDYITTPPKAGPTAQVSFLPDRGWMPPDERLCSKGWRDGGPPPSRISRDGCIRSLNLNDGTFLATLDGHDYDHKVRTVEVTIHVLRYEIWSRSYSGKPISMLPSGYSHARLNNVVTQARKPMFLSKSYSPGAARH